MPRLQGTVLTSEALQSPVAITRAQMIYTSRDALRAVLLEYLWALHGALAHTGWRGVVATMACLASLYLLVSFGHWVTLRCPNVSSVVDKLIADSDQGYVSESVKGQLAIHHVVPPEGTAPRGGQPKKAKTP